MTDSPTGSTSDTTVADTPAPVRAPAFPPPALAVPPPPQPPAPPATPVAPRGSRTWIGLLLAFVVLALLAGATAALFVRVQQAEDRADEAVTIANGQDELVARIDDLDATLASLRSDGTATADDVAAAERQVNALRRCVNAAIESWSEATQSGRAATITKC